MSTADTPTAGTFWTRCSRRLGLTWWGRRLGRAWWGRRLAWCGRRLGLDRNPLRRTVDRVETGVRLTVLILLLVAVPAGVFVSGRTADRIFLRQAQAQLSSELQVTAVLTQDAPSTRTADPYSSIQTTWANARWTAPSGTAHSGHVLVAADARKGSTARIWINAAGAITDPPAGHKDVMAEVAVTVMVTAIVLILLLLSAEALAVRGLDRRRSNAWDAEWRATGPLWTDHRT